MSDTSLESLKNEPAEIEGERQEIRDNGGLFPVLLLVVLLVIHVGMNLWWLGADNHTIRTDEEGHMLLARTYHEALFVKEFADPMERLIAVSQIRPGNPAHPPLFHILGALMIGIFGYSTDTMALTNTFMLVILLLGCNALARSFLDRWQSLFVVFVISMTPMVYASSRFFMTDFATAALVVWAIVALVRSEGFRRPSWVFLFAALNGLGILTRSVSFAYLLLPAILAVFLGMIHLMGNRRSQAVNAPGWGTWSVNIIMALTVTVGVFAPWYYANLEPFYTYWSNKEIGNTRGPLTRFVPYNGPTAPPAPSTMPGDAAAPAITPPTPATLDYALQKVINPAVAWIRYPVYLVNNGLFIPLSALALLGMIFVFLRRQFRSAAVLYLYAWILGSWFFFSVMLRSGTPRYGLPVAPALALFAALFILCLPFRIVRQCAGVLLIAVLAFQYGNITVQSYGEFGAFTIPVPALEKESRHFIDDGLVLYKDHLTLSDAYGRLGAPRSDNYKEQFIQTMIDWEKALPVREGTYANYQKLGLRGMPLYEQHYWPGDNPYRLASLAPGDVPERRLRMIHMGLEPEHLLSRLPETDYILYQVDAALGEQANAYEAFFAARGFKPIARFEVPAFGWVPKTINGVLAKELQGELVEVNETSVAAMNLYDLYELRRSADFARLSPELQALVGQTFETKLAAIATPFPLNDAVSFMAAEVQKTGETSFQFRLIFKVEKAIDRDWRMLFHGFVEEANLATLPAEKQAQGYIDWNFDPDPPTTLWEPGRYVILTHGIETPPMVYQFKFGLFREDSLFGRTALLKTMDLSAIP